MLLVRHPDTYVPERRYVLDVVLREFLGLSWRSEPSPGSGFTLTLDGALDASSLHVADGLFALPVKSWLAPSSVPEPPLRASRSAHALGRDLPVMFERESPPERDIVIEPGRVRVGLDLFGSIFFQLTRYEEVARTARDAHGRFPASASLAWRAGLLRRPVVDEQTTLLRELIERLWPGLRPLRTDFQQMLSHDVDWPLHPEPSTAALVRSAGGDLLRRRSPARALIRGRALGARLAGRPERDPYFCFDFIMDQSERRGLRSAFYFMPGCTDPRYDSRYRVSDPLIERLLVRIHQRGHEIGLHPSYRTFRDPGSIASELRALTDACARLGIEQESWGGRQHFLRWENPVTWRGWEQAGLAYDSSLGYARSPGFRCGTCREYPVFDLKERRAMRLRERPLVFMELACLDPEPGSNACTLEDLDVLRARCRSAGGNFTLLWHNSRLVLRSERRLYRAAL